MGNKVLEMVVTLCQTLCANTFENSETKCVEKHSVLQQSNEQNTTLQTINLKKELQHFCKTHKNRFWILYYRYVEEKITVTCRTCGAQADKCRDYILDRVLKHIKAFDITQESVVFQEVRLGVLEENVKDDTSEVVRHYVEKIEKNYKQKLTQVDEAEALFENAFESCRNEEYVTSFQRIVAGYKTYAASVLLQELLQQIVNYDDAKEHEFRPCIYDELIHQEKFRSYIAKPIKDRLIDFTRSKSYAEIVSDEIEENDETFTDDESIYNTQWLDLLNEEQSLIHRLKYGFELDNRAFLTVVNRLNYKDVDLLSEMSNEEKFYIQMVSKYALEDDSEYLSHMDVPALKSAIEKKITRQREMAQHKSYTEYANDAKKEIYLKLLYREALSSSEIGVIFDLTAKQIDKKIENSKKKIKRSL